MAIEVRPATVFEDVCTMVGPKRPDANVCWCLSYRLPSAENRALVGPARGERVRQLMEQAPPGVLAYDGDEVVGWAAVAPRSDTTFARSSKIPHVDDVDVWSVWCIRVRPGHRRSGIAHDVLRGAVEFAVGRRGAGTRGLPGRQPGRAGGHDHGVRRHACVVRARGLRQGLRHRLGPRRLPPCPHAACTRQRKLDPSTCPAWSGRRSRSRTAAGPHPT